MQLFLSGWKVSPAIRNTWHYGCRTFCLDSSEKRTLLQRARRHQRWRVRWGRGARRWTSLRRLLTDRAEILWLCIGCPGPEGLVTRPRSDVPAGSTSTARFNQNPVMHTCQVDGVSWTKRRDGFEQICVQKSERNKSFVCIKIWTLLFQLTNLAKTMYFF